MLWYNLLKLLMSFVLNSLTYIKSWANVAKNVIMNQIHNFIMNQILDHAYGFPTEMLRATTTGVLGQFSYI